MLAERRVNVDPLPIYRLGSRYAPEMEKRLRAGTGVTLRSLPINMDETYVKVNGRWALSVPDRRQPGRTVDFYLSSRRNSSCIPEPVNSTT